MPPLTKLKSDEFTFEFKRELPRNAGDIGEESEVEGNISYG